MQPRAIAYEPRKNAGIWASTREMEYEVKPYDFGTENYV
jgi:hypothetical protein